MRKQDKKSRPDEDSTRTAAGKQGKPLNRAEAMIPRSQCTALRGKKL